MNKFAVVLAIGLLSTLALAQGPGAPASRGPSEASFICGGVSQEDAQEMKAQARQHALMLTFAESSGAYLADVEVEIRGTRGGVVLSAKCEGPIMLVDLPPGNWRITAQANGRTQQRSISTGRGRTAQTTFVWPAGLS
jgi:hypothetical protein